MDKCTLALESSQEHRQTDSLTSEDRRLLLGASIRVLDRRFTCGKPISKGDVLRVALLADDAVCGLRS